MLKFLNLRRQGIENKGKREGKDMRILMLSLLLLACGRLPQAGEVQSHDNREMVLGLMQGANGAYELQLCADGAAARNCINPLVNADGKPYAFDIGDRSWLARTVRWGAALVGAVIGGAVVFKAGRYFVRKGEAHGLARELNVLQREEKLGDNLPAEVRQALLRKRMRKADVRKVLTLSDESDDALKQEAELMQNWDEQLSKLRTATQQGKVFTFTSEFETNLQGLRAALETLPPRGKALEKFDKLVEELRSNKISRKKAMRSLAKLERKVQRQQRQTLKVLDGRWERAMQRARDAISDSKNFRGRDKMRHGLKRMRRPLAQMGESEVYQRLRKMAKEGTARAEDINKELVYLDEKLMERAKLYSAQHVSSVTKTLRKEIRGKLDQRDELFHTVQDLRQVARVNKRASAARKLRQISRDVIKGKIDRTTIAERLAKIDKKTRGKLQKKGGDSLAAWEEGVEKIKEVLTRDGGVDDYGKLRKEMQMVERMLHNTGDKRNERLLRKMEVKVTKRLEHPRGINSRHLEWLDVEVLKLVERSRKSNRLEKRVAAYLRGSKDVNLGLADDGIVRPKRALSRNLKKLQRLAAKLLDNSQQAQLKNLREEFAAGRLSPAELTAKLKEIDEALRNSNHAKAYDSWREHALQVKVALESDKPLLELDGDLGDIWAEMEKILDASPLRQSLTPEVAKLKHNALMGNWQAKTFRGELEKLDMLVRSRGGFRTAEELHHVQGKERRVAKQELHQRRQALLAERQAEVGRVAADLMLPLREGEKTRRATQKKFAWFDYAGSSERVVKRAEVLEALRNGDIPNAIEVRVGLEKLAAQLTGTTIFIAMPFMLANGKQETAEKQELEPLLQHIAQAVEARVTPAARCWLGEGSCQETEEQ